MIHVVPEQSSVRLPFVTHSNLRPSLSRVPDLLAEGVWAPLCWVGPVLPQGRPPATARRGDGRQCLGHPLKSRGLERQATPLLSPETQFWSYFL